MRLQIRYDDIDSESRQRAEVSISAWLDNHMQPQLSSLGVADGVLFGTVVKRPAHPDAFTVRLHLHLPQKKTIAAAGHTEQLSSAINAALHRLRSEVERHAARLKRQEPYKRKARRQRLRALKHRLDEQPTAQVEAAGARIEALLPELRQAVRWELAYLRAQGDLPADYPTVQDILDEIVVAAKANWASGGNGSAGYVRLLAEMHRILEAEVESSRLFGPTASLASPAPGDAEDQAEAMIGEAAQAFWQPDESLRLGDLIVDESANRRNASAV